MSNLFTDEFPEVESDKELQKVKEQYPSYDPYYIASGCIKERKEKFEELWEIYEDLADSHFLSEVKINFHERTWEMYLGAMLIKNGLEVKSGDKGPDFSIQEKEDLFIEATACQKGEGEDKVPEISYNMVQELPEKEMIMRLTNSLDVKFKKYKEFIQDKEKPYIIAVNRGALKHPEPSPSLIIKCLFGLGFQAFEKENGRLVSTGWMRRQSVEKESKSKVPTTFFEDKEHNLVSAVIYSSRTVLEHISRDTPDDIIVHNPNAKNPISTDIFSFLNQYSANYNEDSLTIQTIN